MSMSGGQIWWMALPLSGMPRALYALSDSPLRYDLKPDADDQPRVS